MTNFLLKHRLFLIFGAIYVALSIFALSHFLRSSLLGDYYYRATFEATYQDKAWKPFVYRILIPTVAKAIVDATPESLEKSINKAVEDFKRNPDFRVVKKFLPKLSRLFPKPDRNYPRLVTIILIYACIWGYIAMMHKLGMHLFPGTSGVGWFAPIFGVLAISSFSLPQQYLYDIPVLFLSAACYYFMAARNFKLYMLFFVLACLNKETSIFILIFFTLWFYSRLDAKPYAALWSLQCFLYMLIKLVLTFAYWHNPGVFLEDGLGRVLAEDVFTRANLYRILTIAMLFFLLAYRWAEKTDFLKMGLLVMPFVYFSYLLYGWPGEYRVFFDVMPLAVLLITHTLIEGTGVGGSPTFARVGHRA